MEQNSADEPDVEGARDALRAAENSRGRVAERIRAPWWYRLGIGLTFAIVFASISFGGSLIVVAAVAVVLPVFLGWILSEKTGVTLDLNRSAPGARRVDAAYFGLLLALTGLGLYLEFGAGLNGAMAVAGALLILPTMIVTNRDFAAFRRAGRGSTA